MKKLVGKFLLWVFLIQCMTLPGMDSTFVTGKENNINEINVHNVINIHELEQNIKVGDKMECEITKTETYEARNDTYVFTDNDPRTPGWYVFQPISPDTKCYSFEVRSPSLVHLAFSNSPTVSGDVVEVVIGINNQALIRKRQSIPSYQNVIAIPAPNFLSANEFRGFWVRWTDDYLIEVGHAQSSAPFMSYRNPAKLSINFASYLTWTTKGAWIIPGEPKCPGSKNSDELKKIQTKSNCRMMSNIDETKKLQKTLNVILIQIKTEYELFKQSKDRPQGFLRRVQQELDEHYKQAKEIKNKILINVEDNENSISQKLHTFNEILGIFYKFDEELHKNLEDAAKKAIIL